MCSAHACVHMRVLIFLIVFVACLTRIVVVELLCFQCLDGVQMDACIDIIVLRSHFVFAFDSFVVAGVLVAYIVVFACCS